MEMKNHKRKPHSIPWIEAMLLELESKGLNQWSRTEESQNIIYRHIVAENERKFGKISECKVDERPESKWWQPMLDELEANNLEIGDGNPKTSEIQSRHYQARFGKINEPI